MRYTTLTTVYDDGAAALTRDALAAEDIPVRLRRRGPDHPYVGLFAKEQIEVQVPEENLEAAREVLAWLERDAERLAMEGGGGASAAPADPEEDEEASLPARRPVRLSTGLVLAVLVPLPVTCLYAGARPLGQVLLGLAAGLFVLALASGQGALAIQALMLVKILDVTLALPRLLHARARA